MEHDLMSLSMDFKGGLFGFCQPGQDGKGNRDAKLEKLSGGREGEPDVIDDHGYAWQLVRMRKVVIEGKGPRKAMKPEKASQKKSRAFT